ncbi:MAG TPA: M55 family metallopeptidase [Holophaga sp.]|nr:M55 family metallopeptidase [Holophaga sp.]
MRVLVSVDIEGIAGVSRPDQTSASGENYGTARRLMTEEANAAVRGAFAGGASEVLVADAHGTFGNLLPDLLDERAWLVHGKPRPFGMLEGIQERPDAVMLVGYHAMAGERGVLAHTVRGTAFHRVWLQDRPAGEAALYGLLAGEFGAPVVLATGDDAFAEETRAWLPRTRFAVVKKAAANRAAISLSPARVRALVESEAKAALEAAGEVPPLLSDLPIRCRVEAKTLVLADLFALLPAARRLAPLVVEFTGTPTEVVQVINLWSAAAASV